MSAPRFAYGRRGGDMKTGNSWSGVTGDGPSALLIAAVAVNDVQHAFETPASSGYAMVISDFDGGSRAARLVASSCWVMPP